MKRCSIHTCGALKKNICCAECKKIDCPDRCKNDSEKCGLCYTVKRGYKRQYINPILPELQIEVKV